MPRSRSRSFESMTRSRTLLVGAEDAALPEHGVDQGGLAVVDVGDDGDVAEIHSSSLGAGGGGIEKGSPAEPTILSQGEAAIAAWPIPGRPECRGPRGNRGPPGRGRRGPGEPSGACGRRRRGAPRAGPARWSGRSRPGGRGGPRGSGRRSRRPGPARRRRRRSWRARRTGCRRGGAGRASAPSASAASSPAQTEPSMPSRQRGLTATVAVRRNPGRGPHPLRLRPEHRDDGGDSRPREETAGVGEERPLADRQQGLRASHPPALAGRRARRPRRAPLHWTTDEPHGSGGSLTPSETPRMMPGRTKGASSCPPGSSSWEPPDATSTTSTRSSATTPRAGSSPSPRPRSRTSTAAATRRSWRARSTPRASPSTRRRTCRGSSASSQVDQVVFAYSDVSHENVMHKASLVLACGADFRLIGPNASMLKAKVPVVSVCAVRTGRRQEPDDAPRGEHPAREGHAGSSPSATPCPTATS